MLRERIEATVAWLENEGRQELRMSAEALRLCVLSDLHELLVVDAQPDAGAKIAPTFQHGPAPLCGEVFESEDGDTAMCDRRAGHEGDCCGPAIEDEDEATPATPERAP